MGGVSWARKRLVSWRKLSVCKSFGRCSQKKSDCIVDCEGTPSFRPQSGWTHVWRSAEDRFLFLAGLFCFRSQPIEVDVCIRCRSTIFPSFRLRRGPSCDNLPTAVSRRISLFAILLEQNTCV